MQYRKAILTTKALGLILVFSWAVNNTDIAAEQVPWEPIGLSGGGGMFTPAISAADPNLMMLNCDMSAAYVSWDGGHNWGMIHQAQLRTDTRCKPAFHPLDPNIIYASSGGLLRISRDKGQTFSPIGNLTQGLYGEIAMSPSDPNFMLTGTRNGQCWLSQDAGRTWTRCNGPQGRALGFHFDRTTQGRTMFAATDQGVWRSDDRGSSWCRITRGLPEEQIQAFAGGSNVMANCIRLYCSVPSRTVNGRFQGGIYCSRDHGQTWEQAMGQGINTEVQKADQWAYDSIAQYKHLRYLMARPIRWPIPDPRRRHHLAAHRTPGSGSAATTAEPGRPLTACPFPIFSAWYSIPRTTPGSMSPPLAAVCGAARSYRRESKPWLTRIIHDPG